MPLLVNKVSQITAVFFSCLVYEVGVVLLVHTEITLCCSDRLLRRVYFLADSKIGLDEVFPQVEFLRELGGCFYW